MKILVLNSGSSSCKLSLYELQQANLSMPQTPLWNANLSWKNSHYESNYQKEIAIKLKEMPIPLSDIDVIGHRIVHGGSLFLQPTLITPTVKNAIEQMTPLAPLHIPQHLIDINLIGKLFPGKPQIAVFDTAFHATLSEAAKTYPGPYSWRESGICRFGFHGISYEYCSSRCSFLLEKENLKIVCCHLGNGASMAAIDSLKSIDTTMGFTPLEGLMMGSRCGSIDPGILLFLEQNRHQTSDELLQILYHNSGLFGISGVSGDMREILKLRSENHFRAALGFDIYIHYLKKNIGAMVSVLDGLDALIFTAGVGENSPLVRQMACEKMQHLGINLDLAANSQCKPDALISSKESTVKIVVIATQEDWCIACSILKMRSHETV